MPIWKPSEIHGTELACSQRASNPSPDSTAKITCSFFLVSRNNHSSKKTILAADICKFNTLRDLQPNPLRTEREEFLSRIFQILENFVKLRDLGEREGNIFTHIYTRKYITHMYTRTLGVSFDWKIMFRTNSIDENCKRNVVDLFYRLLDRHI